MQEVPCKAPPCHARKISPLLFRSYRCHSTGGGVLRSRNQAPMVHCFEPRDREDTSAMSLEKIAEELNSLANLVEDVQRELVNEHACLCIQDLGDVVGELRRIKEIVAVRARQAHSRPDLGASSGSLASPELLPATRGLHSFVKVCHGWILEQGLQRSETSRLDASIQRGG